MDRPAPQSPVRRYLAYVSVLGTTQLHLRNPWVIAWWSAAFPGMGHLLLSKYLRGFLLFFWEVLVNVQAHINLAMFYSFTGRFELAKAVIDLRWLLLYMPTYLFTIWDSYRTTVDLNHQYQLAAREDAPLKVFNIDTLEINYLDKRVPWNAVLWSALMPGLGQVLIHRIVVAGFILGWFIIVTQLSHLLPALHLSALGQFAAATALADPQWLLNIPSLYFFAMYDAYTNVAANNDLYDWELSKYLKRDYEPADFVLPLPKNAKRGELMYVIATFDYSNYLELAITAVQMQGVAKADILAFALDKRGEDPQLFDTLHASDGLSLLDLPFILATIFSLFGCIYGYLLTWGPIIWGLIGMVAGFGLGLGLKLRSVRKYGGRPPKAAAAEVVLVIECAAGLVDQVTRTLWQNRALGVRKLNLGEGLQAAYPVSEEG